ncbi:MAG: hypothetical protein NTW59_01100, partial [Candidatus Diapherotrites archaeon]|nr:hypothetical protein [Candidatus Diapherotrites archaeon]
TAAYSRQAATESLAGEIRAIAGVLDANVSAQPAQPILFVESQEAASEEKFADLNAFLHTLGAESVYVTNNNLGATLSFGEGTTASEIIAKNAEIEDKLKELDVNAGVRESNGLLSGRVELASADSRQAGEAIKNLLAGKGMEAMVRQPGYITLQEVFDPETGATYSIDLNSVSAFLAPGKAIGQDVSVQITYYIVRGKIASIQAFENE